MQKRLFLTVLFCSISPLFAENILIVHSSLSFSEQDRALAKDAKSAVIEAVFAQAFDKGHIVYDIDEEEQKPFSLNDLIQIVHQYKADKAIVIRIAWAPTSEGLKIDHIDHTLLSSNGTTLTQGTIWNNEPHLAQRLTNNLESFY